MTIWPGCLFSLRTRLEAEGAQLPRAPFVFGAWLRWSHRVGSRGARWFISGYLLRAKKQIVPLPCFISGNELPLEEKRALLLEPVVAFLVIICTTEKNGELPDGAKPSSELPSGEKR